MKVILTSFRDADNWLYTHQFSIARWQPGSPRKPEIQELAARDVRGVPLKHLEPGVFRTKYEQRLTTTGGETLQMLIDSFLATLYGDLTLLCWCNPDRQKSFNKLYCHRILVGYWIEKHYPEVQVIYADGAENPIWEKEGKESSAWASTTGEDNHE